MTTVRDFTWGRVLRVHEIGEYEIVEFEPRRAGNQREEDFDPSPRFHAFIDGKDTHHSYNTLDRALAGVIAYKHDGVNTKAHTYFMRAIRADREET
jgi:hypothetical protein